MIWIEREVRTYNFHTSHAQRFLKFECEINIKTYQIFNVDICTLLYQFFHKNNIPSTRCLEELRGAILYIDGRL